MNRYHRCQMSYRLMILVLVMLLSIMTVSATWNDGAAFTPLVKQAGISPVTATASQGDSGTLTVTVFPQHPTQSSASFNKFYSFTVSGSFDVGVEVVSITPSPALVAAGWTITPSFDNNARTFTTTGNVALGSPGFITNKATPLLTINVRSTAIGAQIVRLTGVQMLVAGQNGITDFNHIATITLDACVPSCPLDNTICLGTTDTRSNGCGENCNVMGTKVDVICAPLCTATSATCDQAGVGCPGNTVIVATGCPAGQTCNAGTHTCENSCIARTATCGQTGVSCINGVAGDIPAIVCPAGQTCNVDHVCVLNAGQGRSKAQLKIEMKAKVDQIVDAMPEDTNVPRNSPSFLSFISNWARSIRDLFP